MSCISFTIFDFFPCNSSSFVDVRVLLTCFCTFCSDFLLILTYLLETLSTGYFSLCWHFLALFLTKVYHSILFFPVYVVILTGQASL